MYPYHVLHHLFTIFIFKFYYFFKFLHGGGPKGGMVGDDKQALLQHGVKSGISGRLRGTILAGQTSTVQTPMHADC